MRASRVTPILAVDRCTNQVSETRPFSIPIYAKDFFPILFISPPRLTTLNPRFSSRVTFAYA